MRLKALVAAFGIALTCTMQSPVGLARGALGPVQALIRYPSIYGHTIVFEAGGAIWKVDERGGEAVRLTGNSAYDTHPLISPNGRWVAFTGDYRGNTDVYVISIDGGTLRQLTWRSMNHITHGKISTIFDNIVVGWTPDSRHVVFISRRDSFNFWVQHAFEVSIHGGLPTMLPMPAAGPLSFNHTGTVIAYNRSMRIARAYHRKHYYGGAADRIYTYNLATGTSNRLTHWKGESVFPMWVRNTLYYASDRGTNRVLNLWAKNFSTGVDTEITHFQIYDIDWPSADQHSIVLSDGGRLYIYSLLTHRLRRVSVTVPLTGSQTLPYPYAAQKDIRSASISPNGKLIVFGAQGALFTVPVRHGRTAKLSHRLASNDKDPAWSPNGLWIAYLNDYGIDSQVMVRPSMGNHAAIPLTPKLPFTSMGPLVWSPNGHWLTYSTSRQQLWIVNVNTGVHKLVTTAVRAAPNHIFQDISFSPDSHWLAFSERVASRLHALFIYDIQSGKVHKISRGRFDDTHPLFSSNGKYLFFVSARVVVPVAAAIANSAAEVEPDGLYVTTLRRHTPSLFAPQTVWPASFSSSTPFEHLNKHDALPKYRMSKRASRPYIHIDFKGLIRRAVPIPVSQANIQNIAEADGILYYSTTPIPTIGFGIPGQVPELFAYDLLKHKHVLLARDLSSSFMLAQNGSSLLYARGKHWVVESVHFTPKLKIKAQRVDTSHMQMMIYPRAEWVETFHEAWRIVRDFFVDPALIKEKWRKLGREYAALLPLVQDREDLNYVIGNMMGSLGESHMYFYGGTRTWRAPPEPTAGLGVEFALNHKVGLYYLKKIFRGNSTLPGYYSPLAQPGLKVKAGDYVLAINDKMLTAHINPYSLLQDTLNNTIVLTLAASAHGKPWHILVRPIINSDKLHLLHWIRGNRREVNRLSRGKIGYVYLDNMGPIGLHEFVRQFYGQIEKPGLIIDDRWNLGGFIDTILFDRLLKKPVAGWVGRNGAYSPSPSDAYAGHLAALINYGSASDGDIFAYRFQHYHLGPTIGSRTWGGVRGYASPFTMLDGATEIVSEQAMYTLHSKWAVENIGVTPSIPVHLNPGLLSRDHEDTQLEAAVRVLLREIARHPSALPAPPPWTPAFPRQPHYPPCPVRHGTCT